MKAVRQFLSDIDTESLVNPWIRYAGWPAFWFGLIICALQATLSHQVCFYYPSFMSVKAVDCEKIQVWVPVVQLSISVALLTLILFVCNLFLKRKMLNPFYFLSAALLIHSIYFFLLCARVLFDGLISAWITFGPKSGQLISDSIWSSVNFIFVAWIYALFWTCLREVAGLKGSRLAIGFVFSIGVTRGLVTLCYWYLHLGPIE